MRRIVQLGAVVVAAALVALAASGSDGRGSPGRPSSAQRPAVGARPAPPRRPPVVVLATDEFPIDAVRDPRGDIDAGRYPNLAWLARRSTWFPNASTVYDSTTKAIPAILDGRLPREGTGPVYTDHPRTIFDLLGPRGYRVVSSEEATAICPPRWCPGARPIAPNIVIPLTRDRRERFERWVARIRGGRPALYFKHVLLPHGPWTYLPSGRQSRLGAEPLDGLGTVPGFASAAATRFNLQRQALQLGFLDRELGRLFARMRRAGILDRSLVVLVADHGIATDVGVRSRRLTTARTVDELAPVPFFVKRPNQRRGRRSPAYARTIDVVPTVADVLGLRMPYRADGRSAFSRAVARRPGIRVVERDFSGVVKLGARRAERRRAANLRRRLLLVGHGDWASLFSASGPNRRLVGTATEAGDAAAAKGVVATLASAPAVVDGGGLRPTQVEGRLRGPGSARARNLALAVDGRIEAVGRTFGLGGPPSSFAFNVPESSLHGGRNRLELYEVRGGRLVLLGRF